MNTPPVSKLRLVLSFEWFNTNIGYQMVVIENGAQFILVNIGTSTQNSSQEAWKRCLIATYIALRFVHPTRGYQFTNDFLFLTFMWKLNTETTLHFYCTWCLDSRHYTAFLGFFKMSLTKRTILKFTTALKLITASVYVPFEQVYWHGNDIWSSSSFSGLWNIYPTNKQGNPTAFKF